MNDAAFENFESRIKETAASFAYPPTPDLAASVTALLSARQAEHLPNPRRATLRLALTFALILIVAAGALLSVPAVRAAVLEFLQLGAIRIQLVPSTPTPTPTPAPFSAVGTRAPVPTSIPIKTATPYNLVSLLDLEGQTSLDEAIRLADIPLKLPSYPEGLGEPDYVFLQDLGQPVFIFIWMHPDEPERVRLSLFQIEPGSWIGEKGGFSSFERTTVNGQDALWAVGPYPLILKNHELEIRRIVGGSALIWEEDGVTYRIEGTPELSEAIKIAESLQLIP